MAGADSTIILRQSLLIFKHLPIVEGRAFVVKQQDEKNGSVKVAANMGSDGIAISATGELLYYCPLLVGELLAYLQKGS